MCVCETASDQRDAPKFDARVWTHQSGEVEDADAVLLHGEPHLVRAAVPHLQHTKKAVASTRSAVGVTTTWACGQKKFLVKQWDGNGH